MLALREFVSFITHNKANLAATFADLLASSAKGYEHFPYDGRVAVARKLLNAVIESFDTESADPLCNLFDGSTAEGRHRWHTEDAPPDLAAEIECLGQTLSPVVTNLEAGKFLWQILAEVRINLLHSPKQIGVSSLAPPAAPDQHEASLNLDQTHGQVIQQLKESEARFRRLAAASFELIVLSENGKIIDVNHQIWPMFGYEPSDVIGMPIWDLLDAEPLEGVAETNALGFEQPYEAKLRRKDGSTFIGMISGKSIIYGERSARVAAIQDITALKRSDDLLKIRAQAIEAGIDPITIADARLPDVPLIYVNPAFERATGYAAAEVIGQNCRFLQRDDRDQPGLDELRAAIEDGHACTVVLRNYRKDGTLFWNELQLSPIYDEQGELSYFIGVQNDVTARIESEADLAQRAAELETVAQVSTRAATTLDPQRMLWDVADLTKERFELYHAHIYLLNHDSNLLELAAGAGETGREMIAQGWRIPLDREDSLVAQAARTRRGVIVNDVGQDPGFLPNSLLPETRSEMAIPMIAGEKVVGVLDVQGDRVNRFTNEDLRIQTTLANQIATALENSGLLSETQRRARREQVIREITEKMRSARNLEQLVKITAEELGQRFSAEYVALDLGMDSLNTDSNPSPNYLK